jgi:hypothetical protein
VDRYEQEIKRLDALRPEEHEEWIGRMKGWCRCPQCATYTECNSKNQELLYCYLGKSIGCEMTGKTCDCPVCSVTDELGLKYAFYCLRGPERVLRG